MSLLAASPVLNDRIRVAHLHRLNVLDSFPEVVYDDLAVLATQICKTPIALVSFVDEHRQWFKARVGLSQLETSRDLAFCSHAILQQSVMVVPDTHADPRFAQNPLVRGDPNIRSYAGAPIIHASGHAFGTVCVIDTVPRALEPCQLRALESLARQAAGLLELRERTLQAEKIAEDLRHESAVRREVLLCANDALVILDPEMHVLEASQSFAELLGYPMAEAMALSPWDWDVTFDSKPKVLQRRARSSTSHHFESRWRRKDGSTFRVEIGHSTIRTASGAVVLVIARAA